MSYSISARAATKQAVLADLAAQLDAIHAPKDPPTCEADRKLVEGAAKAALATITEVDESKEYNLRVNSEVVMSDTAEPKVVQTSVSVVASLGNH